jgi:ABC-type Fe3+-hydroxamate transport system, periplasmic component
LERELVGVTHECDYPPLVRSKPVVVRSVFDPQKMTQAQIDQFVREYSRTRKSLYIVDEELLSRLNPDLVITQDVCDVCATSSQVVLEALQKLNHKPEVLTLNPHTFSDVLNDILKVGKATNTLEKAQALVRSLKTRIELVNKPKRAPSVVCLEWLDPLYNAGHWIPELVELAGGRELLGKKAQPSHRIEWKELLEANPEHIFLTICGYDVERTLKELKALKRDWRDLQAVKLGNFYAMNGSWYFSRPGPRLVDGLVAIARFLNGEKPPESVGVRAFLS